MTRRRRLERDRRHCRSAPRRARCRSKPMKRPQSLVVVASLAVVTAAVLSNAAASPLARSRTTARDYGVLQKFAPQSASTWWAVVASNLKPTTFVVRTSEGGKHWRDATPPVKFIASSFFRGEKVGW